MPSSEEECFMAQSTSSLAGKHLKSGEDRILRFTNENLPVDQRVSDTSVENILSLPIFATPTDSRARENRDPGMDIHGPVHKSPQAYQ